MYTPSSPRGGEGKTKPDINYYSPRRSESERAIHPRISGTPRRHPEMNSAIRSRKRKSCRNRRRFISATQITHQTMGRANPTAELILDPPCLIQSHDKLHQIWIAKIRNTNFITYSRTEQSPPGCVLTESQSNIKSWKTQRETISKLYWLKLQMPTR